jgi:hypothetical protein
MPNGAPEDLSVEGQGLASGPWKMQVWGWGGHELHARDPGDALVEAESNCALSAA